MKATELMVGDYIMFDGSPYIIEEISSKGWVHIIDIKNKVRVALSTDYILNFIEGIPLTPDILKKNNFICHEVWDDTYVLDKDKEICTDCEQIGISSRNIAGDWEWYSIGNCKYVHELQNALKMCKINKEIEL